MKVFAPGLLRRKVAQASSMAQSWQSRTNYLLLGTKAMANKRTNSRDIRGDGTSVVVMILV